VSQASVEAAIVATIKLHADFDDTNCVLNDTRYLAKGLNRLAIVSYNSHRQEAATLKMDKKLWNYNVDVLVPWRGEMTTLESSVATETQKVCDILAQYPRLNGTSGVLRTEMTLSTAPNLITQSKGAYRGRRQNLQVTEIIDPGRVE